MSDYSDFWKEKDFQLITAARDYARALETPNNWYGIIETNKQLCIAASGYASRKVEVN